MQRRPCRKQRLLVFSVEINKVPRELVIADAAQSFDLPSSRIDGFHALRFSAVVHVRLERQDAGRFGQGRVALGPDVVGVGGNIQIRLIARMFANFDELGHVPFGIELQAKSHVRRRFLTNRVKMQIEVDLGPRFHQARHAVREHIGIFAEGVFVEECTLRRDSSIARRIVVVLHGGNGMVDDPEAFRGFGLDRLDIPVFG